MKDEGYKNISKATHPVQPKQEQGEPLKDMSEMNRTVAYCAASKLREIGYEWDGKNWVQQEQGELVGWMTQARCFVPVSEFTKAEATLFGWKALYTTPQQRTWVGLTNEESIALMKQTPYLTIGGLLAIEAKLKEKNT